MSEFLAVLGVLYGHSSFLGEFFKTTLYLFAESFVFARFGGGLGDNLLFYLYCLVSMFFLSASSFVFDFLSGSIIEVLL